MGRGQGWLRPVFSFGEGPVPGRIELIIMPPEALGVTSVAPGVFLLVAMRQCGRRPQRSREWNGGHEGPEGILLG